MLVTLLIAPPGLEPIEHFEAPDLSVPPAVALDRIVEATPAFKEWFRATGVVDLFAARSLVTLPYPTRYALWEAARTHVPFIWMTNRVFVVRWRDGDGRTRTLLAEPSDYELGERTPYLRTSISHLPLPDSVALKYFFRRHGTVVDHLAALGIGVDEVDYLVFDHLHTQDIRRLVGTTEAAPDLGYADGPVPPLFPNATMLVQRAELEHVRHAHPFQARFHQPRTYDHIDESRLTILDGDVLVGPGMALLRSPGHTLGNQTIVVNTAQGIVCSSENGVAVDSWAPEHSRIKGVREWAAEQRLDVVLNFNTPEFASWQYNSMIRERLLADPIPGRPELPLVFPSSELAPHPLAPRIRPTYAHGDVTWTAVTLRSRQAEQHQNIDSPALGAAPARRSRVAPEGTVTS
jgi:hypothetical protein